MKVENYFSQLPQWAKGIIAVAIVGGVGFISYKIYKKFKNLEKIEGLKDVVSDSEDEYEKLKNSNQKLSANPAAYSSLCNDIVIKLDGCELASTEVGVIIAITKIVKKPIDWYYLVKVFKLRDVDDCGISIGEGSTKYNLPELLKDQLDTATDYWNIPLVGSGFTTNSFTILEKYLQKIGVTI